VIVNIDPFSCSHPPSCLRTHTCTRYDCDNMETFLNKCGGGGAGNPVSEYSCTVLHGDRKANERRDNLQTFKDGEVSSWNHPCPRHDCFHFYHLKPSCIKLVTRVRWIRDFVNTKLTSPAHVASVPPQAVFFLHLYEASYLFILVLWHQLGLLLLAAGDDDDDDDRLVAS
jgi:hypothetical protein